MHILYLHQYFATPRGKTGTRSYEFARRWVQSGHHVTILTRTAQLTDEDFGSTPRRFVSRLHIDGIEIVALNIPYSQGMGTARRLWAFAWFMLSACYFAIRLKDVDILYVTSTPLTVGIPALLAHGLRGRRYVFEVRDLWPLVPIEMGMIRSRITILLLHGLERAIYRRAEAVTTLSPPVAELVRARAPAGKLIENIPNCADLHFFHPDVDGTATRRQREWNGRFVCLHVGAMGQVNGLDLILRAAAHFRHDPDFLFVLLGEGNEKNHLKAQRNALGLRNLQIVDAVPKQELPAIVAAADVCLMSITKVPVLEHNCANKLFDYLSAGKPVVLNYAGWQRDVLESAEAGCGCSLGDEQAFFAHLAALKVDVNRRTRMGLHARQLAVNYFDRDALAAKLLEVILKAAAF